MNKVNEIYEAAGKISDITIAIGIVACIISSIAVGIRSGIAYTMNEVNKEKANEN